jgi:hypothetical protein
MNGFRIIPHNGSFMLVPEAQEAPLVGFPTPGIIMSPTLSPRYSKKKKNKYRGTAIVNMPPFSPVLSPRVPVLSPGVPVLSPGHVFPGALPGTYVLSTQVASATASATASPGPPGSTGSTGTPAPAAGAPAPASAQSPAISYTVITPPITNIRHITSPDADPELRRKVIKHFYNQLKDVYFLGKFQNLLKYIIVENNSARLVKSDEELQKNTNNNNDFTLRIQFIIDNIISKYDLEVLISKLIAKYGMLYSEDEYNMHWYNAKYKHSRLIKKAMYKKIKYRLQKKVNF